MEGICLDTFQIYQYYYLKGCCRSSTHRFTVQTATTARKLGLSQAKPGAWDAIQVAQELRPFSAFFHDASARSWIESGAEETWTGVINRMPSVTTGDGLACYTTKSALAVMFLKYLSWEAKQLTGYVIMSIKSIHLEFSSCDSEPALWKCISGKIQVARSFPKFKNVQSNCNKASVTAYVCSNNTWNCLLVRSFTTCRVPVGDILLIFARDF